MVGTMFDILSFITLHFNMFTSKKKTTKMPKINYNPEDLKQLCSLAHDVFSKESSLARIDPPVVIVGDIHGHFLDLMRISNSFDSDQKPGLLNKKFLFLGDYVDRGRKSLEVIALLLAIKTKWPKKIILLRGNHEIAFINKSYGFYAELCRKLGKNADTIYDAFNDCFAMMPLAALVGKGILCMHGGISPCIQSLSDIEKLVRPLNEPLPEMAVDLLWADPDCAVRGYAPNTLRGTSVFFGAVATQDFLQRVGVQMLVRAHQVMQSGFGLFFNRKVVTIFSSSLYDKSLNNAAAILLVSHSGELKFKTYQPENDMTESTTSSGV